MPSVPLCLLLSLAVSCQPSIIDIKRNNNKTSLSNPGCDGYFFYQLDLIRTVLRVSINVALANQQNRSLMSTDPRVVKEPGGLMLSALNSPSLKERR